MKPHCVFALLLVPLAGQVAIAQTSRNGSWEIDVRAIEDRHRTAFLARDMAALQDLLSDDYIVNASPGKVLQKSEALEQIRKGTFAMSVQEQRFEQIRRFGDVVVVMGSETGVYIAPSSYAGQVVKRRFTDVWRLENNRWRCIARQAAIDGG